VNSLGLEQEKVVMVGITKSCAQNSVGTTYANATFSEENSTYYLARYLQSNCLEAYA